MYIYNNKTTEIKKLTILLFLLIITLTSYLKNNSTTHEIHNVFFSQNYCKNYNNLLRTNTSKTLSEYSGKIECLTFNTLIAFPDKAFSENNILSSQFDNNKITTLEFKNILENLYKNNYTLLDIQNIKLENINTTNSYSFLFPQDKKPLILIFQNVTYKSSYKNIGEIDKIIIDRNNSIASYSVKQSIQDRINYDNEFILILENFITQHPDFSFNSARGVICFSGENGILGYNTSHKNISSKQEKKRATQVAKKLSAMGWKFGCNNYTYSDNSNISDIQFTKDLSLWKNEIEPLIGNTDIYSFPYGNKSISQTQFDLLKNNNFKIFIYGDNCNPNLNIYNECIYISSREISGNTLRNNFEEYSHMFDCSKVFDYENRKSLFN